MPSLRRCPRRSTLAGTLTLALLLLVVLGPAIHLLGLAQAAVGSALLVASSALALNGSRPTPMRTRPAIRTVLATTAANALTPAGLGGAVLTMRVHRRTGLTGEQAAAAAVLRTAAGALVAMTIAAVTAGTVGSAVLPLPSGPVAFAVALLIVAGSGLLATAVPQVRRLLTSARCATSAAGAVLRRPRCCAALVVGCAGVTAAQLLTLAGAVRAVGGHVALTSLLVTLLGSAAARSAMPSPGGVGPVEAALVGGLTAVGMHLTSATVAVVVYRTAGHWLPVLAGARSMQHLRRIALL